MSAKELAATGAKEGMSDAAWKTLGIGAPIAGAFLSAAGEPSEHKKTGFWGVDPDSEDFGPGRSALADPTGGQEGGTFDPGGTGQAVAGADGGEANAMFKDQMSRGMASITRPLMGQGGTGRDVAGRPLPPEDEQGLMNRQGAYGYG